MADYGGDDVRTTVSFFEQPPDPPPEPLPTRVPWLGPPDGVVPGLAAIEPVVFRGERAALVCDAVWVYPDGAELELTIAAHTDLQIDVGRALHGPPEATRDTLVRFGVQVSDGRKATILDPRPTRDPDSQPPQLVLMLQSGGASRRQGRWRMWLWPLPPPGLITLVGAWPAGGALNSARRWTASRSCRR